MTKIIDLVRFFRSTTFLRSIVFFQLARIKCNANLQKEEFQLNLAGNVARSLFLGIDNRS